MSKTTDPFLPERLRRLNELERRPHLVVPNQRNLSARAIEKVIDKAAPLPSRPILKYVARRQQSKTRKSKLLPALLVFLFLFFIPIFLLQPLFSPLSQLSTRIFDKYNYQELSANDATSRIIEVMVNNQASRYADIDQQRQISPKLKAALERQDITINQEEHYLTFRGKNYAGDQLITALRSNYALIRAINNATGTQRAMFQDSEWKNINQDLAVSQQGFDTSSQQTSNFNQQELNLTKANTPSWRFNTNTPDIDDHNRQSVHNFENAKQQLAATNQLADDLVVTKQAPINRRLPNLPTLNPSTIQNNGFCAAYQTNLFLKNYQKSAQARQYAKLAALFIVESEKARLGEIDPEVYTQLNTRLTETFSYTNADGHIINTKPATDSYAWQGLTQNMAEAPDTNAEKYVIGANQTVSKSLSLFDNFGQQSQNLSARAICGLTQPNNAVGWFFNQITNFFGGASLIGAANNSLSQILTKQAQANASETTLKAMTGLATAPNLSGEDLSNAIISHASYMYYRSAMSSGAGFLTKTQAANRIQAKQQLVAMRSRYEQSQNSPFDASSPYTLVGSLTWKIAPILASSSLTKRLGQFASLFKQSWLKLTPSSQAAAEVSLLNSLGHCLDPDYKTSLGDDIALDAFCVPVVGEVSSPSHLSIDEIYQKLEQAGNIEVLSNTCDGQGHNCQTRLSGDLLKYKQDCLNHATISLETGGQAAAGLGQACAINSPIRQLYSPYFTHQRLSPVVQRQTTSATSKISFLAGEWPAPGYKVLSDNYGPRIDPISGQASFHNGIDIPAPSGTPIIAIEDGIVATYPMTSDSGYGNRIDLIAGQRKYLHAHLSKILVQPGQSVRKGQVIGEVGTTGYSTGNHLHFEVEIDNQRIDPMTILSL